ncbi:hypothetical protein G3O06_23845 [Burkholderia sp. Ac-20345]|uniref:hypothetical protein n=1 Tax=Burkholderia sp. Ac-20345 TaxID=2703891 RepID=UPI00197BBAAE|nr:hypothetical protein [Burkholderia sp. Ac-20345]MBN3780549.1 hypothetical protein [Burkholderia sp. Ac-20345]
MTRDTRQRERMAGAIRDSSQQRMSIAPSVMTQHSPDLFGSSDVSPFGVRRDPVAFPNRNDVDPPPDFR